MANGDLFEHVANKTVAEAGIVDRAKDLGIDAIKAAVGLPESVVGLADIATGGNVGKWIEENTPVQFEETQNILSGLYSDERKQEQQDVSAAFDNSLLSGLGEAIQQPAVPFGTIVQSLPQMIGGRAVASGALKAAPFLGMAGAAGLGEGVFSAGSTAEGIRYENKERDLTLGQSGIAVGSGALTGLLGGVSNKIGAKLGIEDIDIASKVTKETIKKKSKQGLVKTILGGFFTEGILEELPQSTQEQIAINLATDKPWDEGLSEAAGMGIISGGIMGGGINLKSNLGAKLAMVKLKALEQLGEDLQNKDRQEVADGNKESSLTDNAETVDERMAASENEGILQEVDSELPLVESDDDLAPSLHVPEPVHNGQTEGYPTPTIPLDEKPSYSVYTGEEIEIPDTPDYDVAGLEEPNGEYLGDEIDLDDFDLNVNSNGDTTFTNTEKEDSSGLDIYNNDFDAEDFADESVIEPFEPKEYDTKSGIFSNDVDSIEKVETATNDALESDLDNPNSQTVKKFGAYFVRGNRSKKMSTTHNGAVVVNVDLADKFLRTGDSSLISENLKKAIESFGLSVKDFTAIFKDKKTINSDEFAHFLSKLEKAHLYYGGDISSIDSERRATYSVLSKGQKSRVVKLIEKNITHIHSKLNDALRDNKKSNSKESVKDYQKQYNKLELMKEQLTNIYEAEYKQKGKSKKLNTPDMIRKLATEKATSYINRILKSNPEVAEYKKPKAKSKEIRNAEDKYLLSADIDDAKQLSYYKQNYEDIVKEDRSNSNYSATAVTNESSTAIPNSERTNETQNPDNAVRVKSKQGAKELIENAQTSELVNTFGTAEENVNKAIRRTKDVPLSEMKNKKALSKAANELAENEYLSLNTGEKIPDTNYDNSLAGLILDTLEMLGDGGFMIEDIVKYIKKNEGKRMGVVITSLSQLDGYPESLEDMYGLVSDNEGLKDETAVSDEFKEEHEASLKRIEDAIQDHDIVDTEFKGKAAQIKAGVFRKKHKPAIKNNTEVIALGETAHAIPKTVNKNKEAAKITKKKPIPTEKENRDNAKKAKIEREREAIEARKNKKEELERKEQERKEQLLSHVEEEIEGNALIAGMLDGFFEFIDELKSKGKHKAAAYFTVVGVSTHLRKKYPALAKMYKEDPKKADSLVRKLIYSVNSLHDMTFKAYENKQAPDNGKLTANQLEDEGVDGNKTLKQKLREETAEAIGSVTAEDTHAIRQEITHLGEDPELFLLDAFEERVSSLDLLNRTGRNIYTVVMTVNGEKKTLTGVTNKEKQALLVEDPDLEVIHTDNLDTESAVTVGGKLENPVRSAFKSPNGYEVSTEGDSRFAASNAKLEDGRTIQEAFDETIEEPSSQEGTGKPQTNETNTNSRVDSRTLKTDTNTAQEQYKEYKKLWEQFIDENPDLYNDLVAKSKGKTLTDGTTKGPINPARALADIINERSKGKSSTVIGKKLIEVKLANKDGGFTDPIWMPNSEFMQMKRAGKVKFKETGRVKALPKDATVVAKWDNDNTIDHMLESLGKDISEYEDDMSKLFSDYANEMFKQDVLANPAVLDEIVAKYGKYGVTKADLVDAYISSGGQKSSILNHAVAKMHEHFYKVASQAASQWTKDGSKGVISEYVTMRMDETQVKQYNDYKAGKTDALNAEEISFYRATEYVENQLRAIELSSWKSNKEKAKVAKLANLKFASGLQVETEDVFAPNEEQDQSKPYIAGKFLDRVAQKLYEKLASAFGAELLVVSHDPANGKKYKSRYLPKGPNGKPTLVININEPVKFSSIFGHELFHHIVAKSSKAEYKAFTEALAKLGTARDIDSNLSDKERKANAENALKNEEVQAELFAELIYDKAFYDVLSKSLAGKGLAAKIITRLISLISKVQDFFHGKKREWAYEFDGRINKDDMNKAYELVADLIGHSINRDALHHEDTRYHTPLGNTTEEELKSEVKKAKTGKLNALFEKIFPKGSRNRKDMMTRVEGLIKKLILWIRDTKPKGMIADWLVDKTAAKYAMLIQNQSNYERSLAKKSVVSPNKNVYKDYVRTVVAEVKQQMAAGEYVDEKGRKLDPNKKKDLNAMRAILKELPTKTMEKLYDDFARDGIDVSTEEGVIRAKELGYTDEIINTLKLKQEFANKLFEELVEVIPSLKKNKTHYGLSMKWFYGNSGIYNAYDAPTTDEFDQFAKSKKLGGPEQFLKARNKGMTTAEIAAAYGITYKTIDPHEMFLEYVNDAKRLINFRKVLIEGIKTGHVKIFTSEKLASEEGFFALDDDSTKVNMDLVGTHGFRIVDNDGVSIKINGVDAVFSTEEEANDAADAYNDGGAKYHVEEVRAQTKTKISYYTVFTETAESVASVDEDMGKIDPEDPDLNARPVISEIARFHNKDEAEAYAAEYSEKHGKETRVEASFTYAEEVEVARYYYKPELQNMLNITLKKDKFREGSVFGISGKALLNVKNVMSSIQFALSTFHLVTITQELMASYAMWAQMKKHKNVFARYNVVRAWKESRELTTILEATMADKDLANNPTTIKRIGELLNIKDTNALDLMNAFFFSGGLDEADESLDTSISRLAKQKYTKGSDKVYVEDGELKVEHAPFSMSVIKDSIKEAYENALLETPESKLTAASKTALFAMLETTTAYLMKSYIPKVKLATFAREYTMRVERDAEKIANGETTKEEIARQAMKFVEDRFGEVNWKNMWLDPTYKSLLQFTFRSFTWRSGTWKALGKASIDYNRKAWYKLKGEEYELTEHGLWGVNALITHLLTVGLVTASYSAAVLLAGGEVPDDEDTPWLTKLLFPRNDRFDPYSRISIPSYITEFYKIFMHLGVMGGAFEPEKILSGGINSLIINTWEALITGQDWRGVAITDEDDDILTKAFKTGFHIAGVLPISVSSAYSDYRSKGLNPKHMAFSLLGATSAPAASKRSVATNMAFAKRREEHKGKAISSDSMELKDSIKRAAYQYGRGNKEPLEAMLENGEITKLKFNNALKRIPRIDNIRNEKYEDPLYVAVKGLTIEGAIKIWASMTNREKEAHRAQIKDKYDNMRARNEKSFKEKEVIRKNMVKLGIM